MVCETNHVLFLEAHDIHRSRFVALLLSAGCSAWGIRRRQGASSDDNLDGRIHGWANLIATDNPMLDFQRKFEEWMRTLMYKSPDGRLGHGVFLDILPHEVELFCMADEVFKHQNSILINAGYFKARLPGELSSLKPNVLVICRCLSSSFWGGKVQLFVFGDDFVLLGLQLRVGNPWRMVICRSSAYPFLIQLYVLCDYLFHCSNRRINKPSTRTRSG